MTEPNRSILVVSPENSVVEEVGKAFAKTGGIKVDAQPSTLAQMNGKAVSVAASYDIVLFQTSPDDAADIEAIQTLAGTRTGKSSGLLLALADDNISLSQARALNRAGVDDVLPVSTIGQEIIEQVAKLKMVAAPLGQNRQGKIIAVAQARGGVGATTVAVNLADQIAGAKKLKRKQTRSKVALVDFDLQFGTVGSFLDFEEQDTLLQLALDGAIPDATFLGQSMKVMENEMSVLAAPAKFAPLDSLRIDQVAAILDTLRAENDVVVVDMPRALVGWVEAIVERADELVVVTDISVSSIRHTRRLIDFYTADNVALPVKIAVSGEKKPLMQSSMHREASKALERDLDYWLPDDPKAAKASADRGTPLSKAAPRSPLAKAISKMAAELKDNKMPEGTFNRSVQGV